MNLGSTQILRPKQWSYTSWIYTPGALHSHLSREPPMHIRLLTHCPCLDVLTGISSLSQTEHYHIVPHTCSSGMSFQTQFMSPPSSGLFRPKSWNHPWLILALFLIGQPVSQQILFGFIFKNAPDQCAHLHPCYLPPSSLGFRLAHLDTVIVHNWFSNLCHLTHPVILLCQSQRGSGNNCLQPNWRHHWHICKYGRQNPKHSCLTVS